ncbi:hypothetical protein ACH5RR_037831 [Cinchona calisaya]|uniref:KOW domain-containing protein n=1 Tax=Cinchona calisaya TaxID=153742 RepID=A0ABD2Y7D0_9GENT
MNEDMIYDKVRWSRWWKHKPPADDVIQVAAAENPCSISAKLSGGSGAGFLLICCMACTKIHLNQWESKDCKPNSLPVLRKMHVKVGDTIKVISGRDKCKIAEITEIFKHNSTIKMKEINLKTKHEESRGEDKPGKIIKVFYYPSILLVGLPSV